MKDLENAPRAEGNTDPDNERMATGLRKGVRAFFDIDGITITFWGSAWTGLEVIRIEDEIVSRKRSLRFLTRHRFDHAGVQYEILFRVVSMLRGEMEIELYREGELVDSDRVQQNRIGIDPATGRPSAWRVVRQIAPYFVIGLLCGAGAAVLVDWLTGA